jgi:HEAT repeat protein
VSAVEKQERAGASLSGALRAVSLDSAQGWFVRGIAARLLAIADVQGAVSGLIDLFFAQKEKTELWETALAIEWFGEHAAIRRLIPALRDENSHRRHGAARALGWLPGANPRAAKVLVQALLDKSQPPMVREEAAQSLAYVECPEAVPALISVLDEADARLRFWAVFALGARRTPRADPRAVAALERMLSDEGVPPDGWWAVGKEALAMLGDLAPEYRVRLDREIRRVFGNPNSAPEDRRWAELYGSHDAGRYTMDEA